jgi:hypothetical protein
MRRNRTDGGGALGGEGRANTQYNAFYVPRKSRTLYSALFGDEPWKLLRGVSMQVFMILAPSFTLFSEELICTVLG